MRLGPQDQLEAEVQRLHQAHAPALQQYAAVLMGAPEAAQDAVQEIFLRYFVERSYGRVIVDPDGWLFRMLRLHVLAEQTPAPAEDLAAARSISCGSPDAASLIQSGQEAESLVGLLSAREREALTLRSEGLSYEEIAAATGLASGTVGALLTRAHTKIREQLRLNPALGRRQVALAVCALLAGERS